MSLFVLFCPFWSPERGRRTADKTGHLRTNWTTPIYDPPPCSSSQRTVMTSGPQALTGLLILKRRRCEHTACLCVRGGSFVIEPKTAVCGNSFRYPEVFEIFEVFDSEVFFSRAHPKHTLPKGKISAKFLAKSK